MFVDEVEAETQGAGGTCTVALLLASVEERGEITTVLDDPMWKSAAIARALHKRGFVVNADAIGRHRRRANGSGCRCPL